MILFQKNGMTTIASVTDGKQTKPFPLKNASTSRLHYLDANTVLQVCNDKLVKWNLEKNESTDVSIRLPSASAVDLRSDLKALVAGYDEETQAIVVDLQTGKDIAKLDLTY